MDTMLVRRQLVALAVAALLLLCLFSLAQAAPANLFVRPTGSGTACTQASPCTLATALGRAVDGDTVFLGSGTYTGTGAAVITVTRSISIYCGWNGTTATPVVRNARTYVSVIDGENQRRGIFLNVPGSVAVDGCTIVRGNASNTIPYKCNGGGIYSSATMPVLTNNIISGCVASDSPATRGYGGGIYLAMAGPGTWVGPNRLQGNVAARQNRGNGGGIALESSPGIVIDQNSIISNTASLTLGLGYGGGLYMARCDDARLAGNLLQGNVAQAGTATDYGARGGGAEIYASDRVTVLDNTFDGNTASVPSNGGGGGLQLWNAHAASIRHNTFEHNVGCGTAGEGAGRGGGLRLYGSRGVVIDANHFVANRASHSTFGLGGALYLSRNTSFALTNNILALNHASYEGGAIAFETGPTEMVTGTLSHNTFVANNLGSGNGRIALHVNEPYVTLNGSNNLFSGHSYAVYGQDASTVILTRTLFFGNSVADVGGTNVTSLSPISGKDPLLDTSYHLKAGSPAINAGVPAGVTGDIDDDIRPMGGGFDIGADEFYQFTEFRQLSLPLVVRVR